MIENTTRVRLAPEYQIKPFNCGNKDLNEFLFRDASDYQKELLAVTYLFETNERTAAFYSVLNDRIILDDSVSKSRWKKAVSKLLPYEKRNWKSFPAVKLGRLGIDTAFLRKGLGSEIIAFIKADFTIKNKTGCRFVTVDAYNDENVLDFYIKNGFDFLTAGDQHAETRLMFFDLAAFVR